MFVVQLSQPILILNVSEVIGPHRMVVHAICSNGNVITFMPIRLHQSNQTTDFISVIFRGHIAAREDAKIQPKERMVLRIFYSISLSPNLQNGRRASSCRIPGMLPIGAGPANNVPDQKYQYRPIQIVFRVMGQNLLPFPPDSSNKPSSVC